MRMMTRHVKAENKTRYPVRKMSSGVPAGLGRYTGGSALMDSVDGYLREDKMEKSRERNREHAKRTRLRKKVAIESMKDRLIELQNEHAKLNKTYEESNIADILLCLSNNGDPKSIITSLSSDTLASLQRTVSQSDFGEFVKNVLSRGNESNIVEELRNSVRQEAAQSAKKGPKFLKSPSSNPKSTTSESTTGASESTAGTVSPSPSGCSSKSDELLKGHKGLHSDNEEEEDDDDASSIFPWNHHNGNSIDSTAINGDQEIYRKERNRMHAKLTRDRKKLFTSRMQQLISSLERENLTMKKRLGLM